MEIKFTDLFLKELSIINSDFDKCFIDYETKLNNNQKNKFNRTDTLCELIQIYAESIKPDDADDYYWKEKLVLDKMINNDLVLSIMEKKKECVHCGAEFTPIDKTETHQSQYCYECREKHFGKEVIE